jgi:hypothetical protein
MISFSSSEKEESQKHMTDSTLKFVQELHFNHIFPSWICFSKRYKLKLQTGRFKGIRGGDVVIGNSRSRSTDRQTYINEGGFASMQSKETVSHTRCLKKCGFHDFGCQQEMCVAEPHFG